MGSAFVMCPTHHDLLPSSTANLCQNAWYLKPPRTLRQSVDHEQACGLRISVPVTDRLACKLCCDAANAIGGLDDVAARYVVRPR